MISVTAPRVLRATLHRVAYKPACAAVVWVAGPLLVTKHRNDAAGPAETPQGEGEI